MINLFCVSCRNLKSLDIEGFELPNDIFRDLSRNGVTLRRLRIWNCRATNPDLSDFGKCFENGASLELLSHNDAWMRILDELKKNKICLRTLILESLDCSRFGANSSCLQVMIFLK